MKSRFDNRFQLRGTIIKVIKSPATDNKPESAIILVQYGQKRKPTGKAVEFINAALVRIPSYKYEKVSKQCIEGAEVEAEGHMQGVMKYAQNENRVYVELVADALTFAKKPEQSSNDGSPSN